MPAYVLVEAEELDTERALEYRSLAQQSIRRYGGVYRLRGAVPEAVEGTWPSPSRVTTVVEFPDMARLREWYDSPEYQRAKALREGAIDVRLLFAEDTGE
ncbi:DUF1330 domain-containing protein [Amycolatopsis sp. NPDC059021]|uniref:DUF1330 domain-containing protein n=1 Tax=Amycolatopsis sp. NPDC059021 TaxID=3346704 RepID=UPI00366BE076